MKKNTDHLKNRSMNSFTGIIIPTEWNEDGEPLVIAIATDDEQEHRIDDKNAKGRALQKLLRKRVKIEGTLRRDDLRTRLTVGRFKILEDCSFKGHGIK